MTERKMKLPKIGKLYFMRKSFYGLQRKDIVLVYDAMRGTSLYTDTTGFRVTIEALAHFGYEEKTKTFSMSFHDGNWQEVLVEANDRSKNEVA